MKEDFDGVLRCTEGRGEPEGPSRSKGWERRLTVRRLNGQRSVDPGVAALYHGEMNRRLPVTAGALLFSSGPLGCEGAGKRVQKGRRPARSPSGTAPPAPDELPSLHMATPTQPCYIRLLRPV